MATSRELRGIQQQIQSPTIPAHKKPQLRQRLKAMRNNTNIGERDHKAKLTQGSLNPKGRRGAEPVGNKPITAAKPQNNFGNPNAGQNITGKQASRQIPQPPEPFRNPNAALSPVPNGPTGAGSGYSVLHHPAGLQKSKAPKHPDVSATGNTRYKTMGKVAGNPAFYGH